MGHSDISDLRVSLGLNDASSLGRLPLHSTDPLTLHDSQGTMLYESQSTERLYDYEQNELVSEHVTRYFHPEDYDHAVDAFATIVSTERHHPEAVEYHHRQADGSYTWIESVGSSNPTPAGNYILSRW